MTHGAVGRRFMVPISGYKRASLFIKPHAIRFVPLILLSATSTTVGLAQPFLTKFLIDDALGHRNLRLLIWLTALMSVCAALSFGLGLFTTYLYTKLSALILFDMRLAAFQKLQRLSPSYYAQTKAGDIVSRINNDIAELQKLSSDTLLSLPFNALLSIGNLTMMFYLNARLTLLSLLFVPAAIWGIRKTQGRLVTQIRTLREQSASIGSFLIEAILGMRLVVSCNAQKRKDREFAAQNEQFVQNLLAMQITSFLTGALPAAVATLSVALLFVYGGNLVIRNFMTVGALMAFLAYQARLLSPVQSVMGTYSALIQGSVSLGRVFALLDEEELVREHSGSLDVELSAGIVEFENVTFRHTGRDSILTGVSFKIEPHSATALIGPSGAGKSTIADLLLRMYEPESGTVRVDGYDVRTLSLHRLRESVAIVDQTPFFFHASILDNLRFARPDVSIAEIRNAVRAAGIEQFVEALPEQYSTMLGERGSTLSAGERQRLAIARALLRKPAVLILDEPTSALDSASETALCDTLRSLAASTTLLIVTHRPALLEITDHVLELRNGQVLELETLAAR